MTKEELKEYEETMKTANKVFIIMLVIVFLIVISVGIYNCFN